MREEARVDFYTRREKTVKNQGIERTEISPDFIVGRTEDLMIRAGSFYAVWDEAKYIWSTNEFDVARLVDADLRRYALEEYKDEPVVVKDMRSFDSQSWVKFRKFVQSLSNSYYPLDECITFANDQVKKEDYVSKKLSYPLEHGDYSAWDELVGTLYSEEERAKIEWAIGAVVSGDSKIIQKFLVFYGAPGTGKSTVLNIIHKMFYEYTTVFEAKALASSNNAFSTEAFKSNPLVALQHDGDLSRIEDNTKLNSIVAHEDMLINEKYKAGYMSRVNAMLFMGTNQPVKISDARSGIIRRLIDVNPTGDKIPQRKYISLMKKIEFEHGAIATRCLEVYKDMGKHYYDGYRPMEMMYKTDAFFNFVEAHYDIFVESDGISLKRAWMLYKEYVDEAKLQYSLQMNKFREELKDYFRTFEHRAVVNGETVTSYFSDFDRTKFQTLREIPTHEVADISPLVLDQNVSILDTELASMPAQYATKDETPGKRWDDVTTTLADINTKRLHYVKVPENLIIIDFDIKDENGEKSLEKNLEAANLWPATYAELSKSGSGVHLQYFYSGDPGSLRTEYADGIEVKVFTGNSSLRRKLSICNDLPISVLNGGLPLKEKKLLPQNTIQSEKGLRELIARNLQKQIHPGTKPSIDFIKKILDDAHDSGMVYDVTDLRSRILAFANNSSNQSLASIKMVQQMRFASEEDAPGLSVEVKDDRLVFYDIEVYPNLFVVCWKFDGAPKESIVRMINPNAQDIEPLFKLKLVGFNNRRYDNHILYARYMGANNAQLYATSQKIIEEKNSSGMFGEAYNLSYTDIYDYASEKKGLKKWQIELGIHHQEMDLPWDQPVPEELWDKVVDYCCNDVESTEVVHHAREGDFKARLILAELSGLTANHTTNNHSTKIIFGNERNPQSKFVYTDLAQDFPGYTYSAMRKPNKSEYRGEDPSEGGYVYSEPGIYENVAVLDVASMHPASMINMNIFGTEYTNKFRELRDARVAIKRKDFDLARKMLGGVLSPYLTDAVGAKTLSDALKIVINSVYGLTSASFPNPFKDPRNKDNIVAKRGALFMIDLKHFVQERGFTVAHIKTDSIKIPNATPEIIQEVFDFGTKYGYEFEHEETYKVMALVNDAVYIAQKSDGQWDATGAQFAHPYVFKTLFSKDPIDFEDICETKQVAQGHIYMDFDHDLPPESEHRNLRFVGRTGRFVPVNNGAVLYRIKDGKEYAVTGTKGYYWIEADIAENILEDEDQLDMSYFNKLVDEAKKTIEKFGSFDAFVGNPPWELEEAA